MTRDHIVCSHMTLHGSHEFVSRFSFEDRVAAAAGAGFDGIGVLTSAYRADRATGLSQSDMGAILEHHGIPLVEIDYIADWSADRADTARVASGRAAEDAVWEIADALGARVVNAIEIVGPEAMPPLEATIERFAALCDRARDHGLMVALEFLPWSGIPDAATAGAIVRGCERPNAGVNADIWHHSRGSADDSALREIVDHVIMVQLNDADPEPVGSLMEDSVSARRCPGEGSFDVEGFIRLLDQGGLTAPLSVEIPSTAQFALPVDEAARRAFRTTKRVIDAARA